ncbi:MAG: aminoacyl-tRNA hydrolase [Patescibacteria group bacterium]|nr:aminoacyl-tRNA hydrolase [Patescibacteria group bacterium]
MQIIIGLGNPGSKYADTRHNAGWLTLDHIAGSENWKEEKKFNALIKEAPGYLYIKPLSFMNKSGESAYKALSFYKLIDKHFLGGIKKEQSLQDCLYVIQDDLDLNLGTWKISQDSRSGGNRGIQSIITHLKTQKFTRLRLGIKTDKLHNPLPADKFVLQRFSNEELKLLNKTLTEAIPALQELF